MAGGGGLGGGANGKPEASYTFQQDCLEHLCVQEVLIIGPGKPRGTKRCLINTVVNIRPIPPIQFPP